MQPRKRRVSRSNTAPATSEICADVPRIAASRASPSNALFVASAFGLLLRSDWRSPMIVNNGSLFDAAWARASALSAVKSQASVVRVAAATAAVGRGADGAVGSRTGLSLHADATRLAA